MTTHVRVHPADKQRLLELAAEWGVSVPDVIHRLLEAHREASSLREQLRRLEGEIDRLDNCISNDRHRVEQWVGEMSARLARVERKLGISVGGKFQDPSRIPRDLMR